MSNGKSTDENRQENFRTEYGVVAEAWKFIALVGLHTTIAIMWIEERTVMFLLKTMRRGTELEFSFGAIDGFFHRLTEEFFLPQGVRKIARGIDGLTIVYAILFLLWLYLLVANLINP